MQPCYWWSTGQFCLQMMKTSVLSWKRHHRFCTDNLTLFPRTRWTALTSVHFASSRPSLCLSASSLSLCAPSLDPVSGLLSSPHHSGFLFSLRICVTYLRELFLAIPEPCHCFAALLRPPNSFNTPRRWFLHLTLSPSQRCGEASGRGEPKGTGEEGGGETTWGGAKDEPTVTGPPVGWSRQAEKVRGCVVL